MKWDARVLFLIFNIILIVYSKKYDSRCKLVRDLLRNGLNNDQYFGSWVCLIEQVSKRDTSAKVEKENGKKFYGLYQIPSNWCKEGKRGGDCNVSCESLVDDYIKDDTECANKILMMEGFKYWSKWEARCKNNLEHIITEIYKCPDLAFPRASPERLPHTNKMTYRRTITHHHSHRSPHSLREVFEDIVRSAKNYDLDLALPNDNKELSRSGHIHDLDFNSDSDDMDLFRSSHLPDDSKEVIEEKLFWFNK